MIKPEHTYKGNGNGLYVIFQRMREGPHHFLVMYKNKSQMITTTKEMKKILGTAKFLDSSKDLYEWMEELLINYSKSKPLSGQTLLTEQIKKESFGPEAHDEPNENTKMIV